MAEGHMPKNISKSRFLYGWGLFLAFCSKWPREQEQDRARGRGASPLVWTETGAVGGGGSRQLLDSPGRVCGVRIKVFFVLEYRCSGRWWWWTRGTG